MSLYTPTSHAAANIRGNRLMNLPNRLTVLRVILVPVFVLFLLGSNIPYHFLFALIIFCVAAITDALDGQIARKRGLITTFGKFLDPLADKVLVLSAMICFIALGFANAVVVIIVITREFMVTSLRLLAAADGTVIAASLTGKVKTAVQMVSIIAILLMGALSQFVGEPFDIFLVGNVLMWLTAIVTVLSGVDYLIKNKSAINTF